MLELRGSHCWGQVTKRARHSDYAAVSSRLAISCYRCELIDMSAWLVHNSHVFVRVPIEVGRHQCLTQELQRVNYVAGRSE